MALEAAASPHFACILGSGELFSVLAAANSSNNLLPPPSDLPPEPLLQQLLSSAASCGVSSAFS